MSSGVFYFKQFSITQKRSPMKVGTDGVLLGAWCDLPDPLPANFRILDIGTGTGLIALMLAQKIVNVKTIPVENARIDAIDLDENSCHEARENAAASGFSGCIEITHSAIQDFAKANSSHYDLIITNPPFFNKSLKSPDQPRNAVRHADAANMNAEILIWAVKKRIASDGRFCIILPKNEGDDFICRAEKEKLFCCKITRVYSKPQKPCKRQMMEFRHTKSNTIENELIIETGKALNEFSDEYKRLTRDYYL